MSIAAKPNPFIELAITLIIPSIILMKLSGPEDLGHGVRMSLSWQLLLSGRAT